MSDATVKFRAIVSLYKHGQEYLCSDFEWLSGDVYKLILLDGRTVMVPVVHTIIEEITDL